MPLRISKSGSTIATFKILNFDSDAQTFLTAAGITNSTQQNAINKLTIDLKYYGLWTKMKALYPVVGGTATSHKWNLKDPRDLDAAFRLTFTAGWTHSSTGMTPNGSSDYADTKLTPSTSLTTNNASLSYYSRTNNVYLGVDMGVRNTVSLSDISLATYGGATLVGRINTYADSANLAVANTLGFFQITRTGGSTQKVFKNSVSSTGNITTSTAQLTYKIYIGAMNADNLPNFYNNRQCAFASIGDGLTDQDAINFYNIVQQYQINLGRQV
jgi:hypothetical protein